jgi:hypothetical protein
MWLVRSCAGTRLASAGSINGSWRRAELHVYEVQIRWGAFPWLPKLRGWHSAEAFKSKAFAQTERSLAKGVALRTQSRPDRRKAESGGFKYFWIFTYNIWDVILPIDFHSIIFQRGGEKPPPRQYWYYNHYDYIIPLLMIIPLYIPSL